MPVELETLKAGHREKRLNYNRYNIHFTCSNVVGVAIFTFLVTLICGLSTMNSFELPNCVTNTYESDNLICEPCLPELGITCAECSSKNLCSKCKEGYMQTKNIKEKTVCDKCQLFHGENCDRCDKYKCMRCVGNNYLDSKGVCVDCVT